MASRRREEPSRLGQTIQRALLPLPSVPNVSPPYPSTLPLPLYHS